MNIQSIKIELVKTILNIESDEFIQKIAEFIKKQEPDFWNDLNHAEKEEIKAGIAQLDQGKRIEYNDFLKKISE